MVWVPLEYLFTIRFPAKIARKCKNVWQALMSLPPSAVGTQQSSPVDATAILCGHHAFAFGRRRCRGHPSSVIMSLPLDTVAIFVTRLWTPSPQRCRVLFELAPLCPNPHNGYSPSPFFTRDTIIFYLSHFVIFESSGVFLRLCWCYFWWRQRI